MSTEDNKALAHRAWEETMNQRNLAVFDELHVPDFVYHSASRTIQGREPVKQLISMVLTALPDLHVTIEDTIRFVARTKATSWAFHRQANR